MEKTIVPMSKEDSELVEMYFYRYNAYAELLNYLMKNTIIKENQGIIKESIENYTRRNDFLLIARIVLKD